MIGFHGDEMYTYRLSNDYLNSLSNDNCLKDSSISLLSDHGLIIQSIFYILEFYKIENELPIVICYN